MSRQLAARCLSPVFAAVNDLRRRVLWKNVYIMSNSFKDRKEELKKSLSMLEAEVLNFSVRFINDSGVRKQYLRNIKAVSE